MSFHRPTRTFHTLDSVSSDGRVGAHAPETVGRPDRRVQARSCPTPHLTTSEYVRLLEMIDEAGGVVTIDDIARALPQVSQPVSAVFDLCDAGSLNVDWEAAFGGDMHVWRVDR